MIGMGHASAVAGRLAGPPTRVTSDTRTRTKPWIVRVRPPSGTIRWPDGMVCT